jgi:hypothetical protein
MNFIEALSTSLVDIICIHSKSKPDDFPQEVVDELVRFILSSGGLINPIIVKRLDEDNFEVVVGDLEYFAFLKASKENSDLEMIRSIIITSEQEDLIKQQTAFLRPTEDTSPLVKIGSLSATSINAIATKLLEGNLGKIEPLNKDSLKAIATELKEQIASKIEDVIKEQIPKQLGLLEFINSSDKDILIAKLSSYGISEDKVERIYNARIKKKYNKFDGYRDMLKSSKALDKSTKNMGTDGLLKLIDEWRE